MDCSIADIIPTLHLPSSHLLVLSPNLRVKGNVLGMNIINFTAFLSSEKLMLILKSSQIASCRCRTALHVQCGMFLISLSEHEQGRALAIPGTAFVPWYNMGLISLVYVGPSFQGTFVIPWEMLHTRVLTWFVSPRFASCSIPDLPFVHILRWVSASTSRTLEMCLLQHAGLHGTGIITVFYWISFNLESVGGFMPSVCL